MTITPPTFTKPSPASFDSYSLDNDKEQSEFDKDSSESNTGVSEQSEVGSSTKKNKKKKRKGRRSVWEERHVNDLVDVICSSEYYKQEGAVNSSARLSRGLGQS